MAGPVWPALLESLFLDADGRELEPGGVHLSELASISTDGLLKEAAG